MTADDLTIATRVAFAGFEEHEFCGHPVYERLAGRASLTALSMLPLAGRVLSDEECALVDDLSVCSTMADPRIWPLKLTRIVGSYGSFLSGFVAGHLAMDQAALGAAPVGPAMEVLRELAERVGDGVESREAVRSAFASIRQRMQHVPGVGVPFRPRDERFEGFAACVRSRGIAQRRYWRLVETLRDVLRDEQRKIELNLASAIAAIALDLGLEPAHGTAFTTLLLAPCFIANAQEAVEQRSECLRSLSTSSVDYRGRARRESPAASRARAR